MKSNLFYSIPTSSLPQKRFDSLTIDCINTNCSSELFIPVLSCSLLSGISPLLSRWGGVIFLISTISHTNTAIVIISQDCFMFLFRKHVVYMLHHHVFTALNSITIAYFLIQIRSYVLNHRINSSYSASLMNW